MMQNNKYTDDEFNFMFPYAVEGYGANEEVKQKREALLNLIQRAKDKGDIINPSPLTSGMIMTLWHEIYQKYYEDAVSNIKNSYITIYENGQEKTFSVIEALTYLNSDICRTRYRNKNN